MTARGRSTARPGSRACIVALFAANLLVLLKTHASGTAASPPARCCATGASWPGPCGGWPRPARRGHRPGRWKAYFGEKSGLGLAEINDRRIAEIFAGGQGAAGRHRRQFLFIKGQSELARFSPHKKSALELKKDLQTLRGLLKEIDGKMK